MTITLDTLTLPDACLWQNEFSPVPLAVGQTRTISGRLLYAETPLAAGRPIDLGDDSAWLPRANVATLHAWAATPGWASTLTLHDGRTYHVRFRTQEASVLEAVQLRGVADPDDDELYQLLVLRLETC